VGESSLVVGIPFTSPVILAKEMNIPCFYYVPDSASNWEIGKRQDDIAVIIGRSELSAFIQNMK
jgi:polysaccharide biosynthesis PFTS motif protein